MDFDAPQIPTKAAVEYVGNGAAFGRLVGCSKQAVNQMGDFLPELAARRLLIILPATSKLDKRQRKAGKRVATRIAAKRARSVR
jgi:DNA-binding transcriptional regulator YdaS (Cro superfamily)